jgi:beta-galactosidase/beta-glucuronidase
MKNIIRPEYPRPQMVRDQWVNLNGTWEFEMDHGRSGRARDLPSAEKLGQSIIVPFCPESELSGIRYTDFMSAVWYRRSFDVPMNWQGSRILIHFGAVDYDTEVWINGQSVGKHSGGYSSFSFDITSYLKEGEPNVVTVLAEDDVRTGLQTGGKQSSRYASYGCYYTRSTGIWQTVWLEAVSLTYVDAFQIIPDPANQCAHLTVSLAGDFPQQSMSLQVAAMYQGKQVGFRKVVIQSQDVRLTMDVDELHLWEPGEPKLYDLVFILEDLKNGKLDQVQGYFGMRTVAIGEHAVLINGKVVFQRLVLDQGFYPDGLYTAPSDEAMRRDIELAMELGFNGARLHEKVFEPRYLYWADQLGYIVWGEHANWGLDITTAVGLERFLPEWLEVLKRDFNHPSIIGWCPFNETWDREGRKQDDEVLRIVYQTTKAIDTTRPVKDTSGLYHVVTDIYSIHEYEQDPIRFAEKFEPMKQGGKVYDKHTQRQQYQGQPYHVAEFGGIWWDPEESNQAGWGYGDRPKTEQEFLYRYTSMITTLLSNPRISGFCYTQLYDVEQEVNGLLTYSRKSKFDIELIRKINLQPAAIEQ